MIKSKSIGIGIGVAIVGLIIVFAAIQTGDTGIDDAGLERELASAAIEWEYYNLLENIGDLEGQVIQFTGTVTIASNNDVFGINVGESSINQDIIFVEYKNEKFEKRDFVEGFGYVKGIRDLERANSDGSTDIIAIVPNIEAIQVSCTSC